MDSGSLRSRYRYHLRSVSLPTRPHPLVPQSEEHFRRLSASKATSSSLSSVAERLSILEGLYECLDASFSLQNTQQVFSQQRHEKWVEGVMDGYLRLLDLCAVATDICSQAKQDLQGLLSTLRRRRDGNELGGYLSSRKKAKKEIQKSLKNMKSIRSKQTFDSHKDHETVAIAALLKDVELATLAMFESLFSYVSGTKVKSTRLSGFSSVLSKSKDDGETNTNEFERVDVALNSVKGHKTSRFDATTQVEEVQNQLQKMELSIQDVEGGLESLFRRLIRTRVSLLNILNH